MKKIFSKTTYLLFFLLSLFLLSSEVYAGWIPIDVEIPGGEDVSCSSDEECVQRYGAENLECRDRMCYQFVQPPPPSSLQDFQETVQKARENGEMPRERWAGDPESSVVSDIVNSLTTSIMGEIDWETFNDDQSTLPKLKKDGALSFASNLISSMYSNPPASSKEYLADMQRNLGVAKPAYAQGVGFSGLSNLLPLWKASRNLAYIFFFLAFVYIGLAIMFRVKISPQAAITVQNALPKLVIALILVTFSYAIVGLMVDLIYILINLGVLAFYQTGLARRTLVEEQNFYTNLGFFDTLGLILGGTGRGLFIGSPILAVVTLLATVFAAFMSNGVILLIIGVLILFMVFKIFLSLLISYAHIIIATILGPIQIVFSTFSISPKKEGGGVGAWLNNLLANILVFPAVALFIMISWYLTGLGNSESPVWTPPVMGVSGEGLPALIGVAMLYMTSKVPDMVKGAFKMKPVEFGPLTWLSRSVEGGASKRLGEYVMGGKEGGLRTDTGKAIETIGTSVRSRFGKGYSSDTT